MRNSPLNGYEMDTDERVGASNEEIPAQRDMNHRGMNHYEQRSVRKLLKNLSISAPSENKNRSQEV